MAFVLKNNRIVTALPMIVETVEHGGEVRQSPITVDLEMFGRKRAEELMAVGDDGVTFVRAAIKGWDGVIADDGNPIVFDAETLEQVAESGEFRAAVIRLHQQVSYGRRLGN